MNDRLTRVLVIKFGPSGDFVLSLPAMRRIREAHPRAWITLLTTPQ
ncbi:MAG: glycosyltransferase family 9 protein, partial [Caulobacteraceae bacterium]